MAACDVGRPAASQSTRLTTPYSLLAGLSRRGKVILRSTAAAEAALADSVASVLALHEEFFVRHDRLVRMRLPAMLHVGLIVGNADHQTRGAYRPFFQRHDVRQGSLPGYVIETALPASSMIEKC